MKTQRVGPREKGGICAPRGHSEKPRASRLIKRAGKASSFVSLGNNLTWRGGKRRKLKEKDGHYRRKNGQNDRRESEKRDLT